MTPLVLLALAASVHAEPLFSSPFLSFDTEGDAVSVASADLNGDGRLDLVTARDPYGSPGGRAEATRYTVSVLLGSGDGTFGAKTNYDLGMGGGCDPNYRYPCPVFPVPVAIADVNADGRPDLAVANPVSNKVSVLLGIGDGTFGPKTDFVTGTGPRSVAIADFNADGRSDLVVANYYTSTVSLLLGNGDGTFEPKTDFITGGAPISMAVADLNADGRPDVTVANRFSHAVSVLLGNGDGTFSPKTEFASGNGPVTVAIADLNADGHLDLAVANGDLEGRDPHDPNPPPPIPNSVSVLLGYGDGTFAPNTDYGSGGYSVAIADMNADGRPDLASGAPELGGGVWVLLGNGDGTFASGTSFLAASRSIWLATADLNADGRPDVAAAGGSVVSVLLGNGDGTFGPTAFGTRAGPRTVATADLNVDGRLDVAVTSTSGAGVSVLLGNGDGTLGPESYFGTGNGAWDVAIADLNADGRPDLAVANLNANTVSVLLGNGDGTFGPKTDYTGSSAVAITDLNADGRPDLVTANYSASGLGTGNTVSVRLGNGDGTFGPNTDFGTGTGPFSMAIADLNADGRHDLAVANYAEGFGSTVSVLLGNGDGTFGPKTDLYTGNSPSSVAISDLNADGRPDLAVANYSVNTVSVLLGNGDGTFGLRTFFDTGSRPQSVAIRDLNGDGRLDVTVSNFFENTVSVLLGNGDGTFAPKTDYGVGRNPASVAIADFNVDGRPDLVAANYTSNTVTVLLHTVDGPVATLLAQFDATSGPDGIELRWSFGDASRVSFTAVERAPNAVGPWAPIAPEQRHDGDVTAALDRTIDSGRTYFYRLNVRLVDGSSASFGPISSTSSAFIGESAVNLLAPNPARTASQIQYSVARAGHVRLEVADVAGRVVTTLFDGIQQSGRFRLAWDGTNRGERLPAGLYFIRLRTLDGIVTKKITRLP